MATFDNEYFRLKEQEYRKREKVLLQRYHSWEQYPGETFTDFKKRVTGKTIQIENISDKIYRGWERMPNETEKDFKHRLSSKKANKF